MAEAKHDYGTRERNHGSSAVNIQPQITQTTPIKMPADETNQTRGPASPGFARLTSEVTARVLKYQRESGQSVACKSSRGAPAGALYAAGAASVTPSTSTQSGQNCVARPCSTSPITWSIGIASR